MLGPVEVRRDGRLLPLPGGKPSELLVHLALEAGVFVPTDRLIDDLWAGAVTRRNTLQSKVARLRRACGDPAPDRRDATAATGSRSNRTPSTRCACSATPPPRPGGWRPATSAAPRS